MSKEYPTIEIKLPLEETQALITRIAQDLGASLSEENQEYKFEHEYRVKLTPEQTEQKLGQLASQQYKSKSFMFIVLGCFMLILTVLFGVSSKFAHDDVVHNREYVAALSQDIEKAQSEEKKQKLMQQQGVIERQIEQNSTKSRLIALAGGVVLALAALFFFLSYWSKAVQSRKLAEIRESILKEWQEKGQDGSLDDRKKAVPFRLFHEEGTTEMIFEVEEGYPIILYLIGLMMQAQAKAGKSLEGFAQGNEPIKEIYDQFKVNEIVSIDLDRSVLEHLTFRLPEE